MWLQLELKLLAISNVLDQANPSIFFCDLLPFFRKIMGNVGSIGYDWSQSSLSNSKFKWSYLRPEFTISVTVGSVMVFL